MLLLVVIVRPPILNSQPQIVLPQSHRIEALQLESPPDDLSPEAQGQVALLLDGMRVDYPQLLPLQRAPQPVQSRGREILKP